MDESEEDTEAVTDDERLAAMEQHIIELFERVGSLDGATDQITERIADHDRRLNSLNERRHG